MKMNSVKVFLMFSTFMLGLADLVTTNEILHLGLGELNPIMRLAQEWLGVWWLVPKIGLTFVVMWLLWHGKNLRHIAYVVGFLSTPVLNNLIVLAGTS